MTNPLGNPGTDQSLIFMTESVIWRAHSHYRIARYPDGRECLQQLWQSERLDHRWEDVEPVDVGEDGQALTPYGKSPHKE